MNKEIKSKGGLELLLKPPTKMTEEQQKWFDENCEWTVEVPRVITKEDFENALKRLEETDKQTNKRLKEYVKNFIDDNKD